MIKIFENLDNVINDIDSRIFRHHHNNFNLLYEKIRKLADKKICTYENDQNIKELPN